MRLAGFTEVSPLGAGAFGRVVLAREDSSGAVFAVKYLYDQNPTARAWFRHEAGILRHVVSPHVARLYAFVEQPDGAAIVMEAVPGVPLAALLADGAMSPESALTVLKGSLLGLSAAHQAGTVHRDYKPGNVLVQPNRQSKLVDFGIAVLAGQSGAPVGTPNYMAPEQWSQAPATPATDVYAATCVFFRCVAGHPPFAGDDLRAQHEHAPIPADAVPEPLRPLILRGMAKSPAERPPTAAEFVAQLESLAANGYGPDWESRGWERLAGKAATLLSLTPLAGIAGVAGVSGAGAGGVATSAVAAGSAGAGAGTAGVGSAVGGAATASGVAGGVGGGVGGGVAGAASSAVATTGVGVTAGGGAATATTAIAAKVAIGVLAVAAVTTTAVVVVHNSSADEPTAPPAAQVSASVQNRAETFPTFRFNGQVVHVTGIADKAVAAKVDQVLAKPVDDWIAYTKQGLAAGGLVPPTGTPSATSEAHIVAQTDQMVSARYDLTIEDAGDAFGNHGGYQAVGLTVDLTTGKQVTAANAFPKAASSSDGAAALDALLTDNAPQGFCEGEDQPRTPLEPEYLRDNTVQVMYAGDGMQFLIAPYSFGYPMACSMTVVSVPYAQLRPLMDVHAAALIPEG
ncbi:serine/threonine-protein kinase [Labedaea rhizosphaerae]|uniref:non-specific serine/threonine protein kinase n=1 Tax=Labedaea rhizosphaerae TaxID=598644 RepID=A0A4R6SLP2_LABRH|nr:serine/threonine-protein kinase [Labedaea rhizosphaerae]TDQ04073.1 serine/threonine-protein kinase [Labedaea rhizosphaerae]